MPFKIIFLQKKESTVWCLSQPVLSGIKYFFANTLLYIESVRIIEWLRNMPIKKNTNTGIFYINYW